MKYKDLSHTDDTIYASLSGIICLILFVILDSFTSNYQEKLCDHNVKGIELAFGTSFFTTLLLASSLSYQNGFAEAFNFLRTHEKITWHVTALALRLGFFDKYNVIVSQKWKKAKQFRLQSSYYSVHDKILWCRCFHYSYDWSNHSPSSTKLLPVWRNLRYWRVDRNRHSFHRFIIENCA